MENDIYLASRPELTPIDLGGPHIEGVSLAFLSAENRRHKMYPSQRLLDWKLALVVGIAGISVSSGIASAVTVDARYGGKFEIDTATFRIYDVPYDRFEALTGLPLSIMAPERPPAARTQKDAMATGKVLTLMIEWENRPADQASHPSVAYDSLLYSDGIYPTGSANDYYQEVSYGAFSLSGSAVGWLYQYGNYNGDYVIEDIINGADPIVNFSQYDGDGNGKVDALWIVYSGYGQNETHDPWDIWPHAMIGANVPTDDGVSIDRWSVQPEMHLNGEIMAIRVFCHEYGHILGLPDLYDYDDKLDTLSYFTWNDWNDHPVNDWDVMGYGGYAIMNYSNRSCPSHLCGWSRTQLGWSTPTVPPCLQGAYQLYNVEEYSTQSVFKIPISGQEYFLLEYRNTTSSAQFDHDDGDFSAYCPWFTPGRNPLDQGLLITHIDDGMGYGNNGTPGRPHYHVAVEDAGYDPAHPWDGTEFTEWWYPYEFQIGALFSPDDPGQTYFGPSTTPSSDGYGGPTGIEVTVIGQNSEYLTLLINKPLAPIFDPISTVTATVGDSLDVGVFASDPNCTTPGLSPLSLPPYATFWDSGGGRGALILEPEEPDLGAANATLLATDGGKSDTITVQITVTMPPCNCACHADPACDGAPNILDVIEVVNRAFRAAAATVDDACPLHSGAVDGRTDVNCSGATDILDVVAAVDVAFRGANASTMFCDPCL